MALTGIYKITSPSGRVYIGQSRNISKRVSRYKGIDCRKQLKIFASILKYGWENHKVEVAHELPKDTTQEVLNIYEVLYMETYKDCGVDLLNLRVGGHNGTHCEETRQKLKVITAKTQFKKGNATFKGKKHSVETIKAMRESAIKRGNNLPTGFIHSVETRLKISKANMGKPSPRKGKVTSEITKEKQRLAKLGLPAQRQKKLICSITGVIYKNIKEAAIVLGIKRTTLNSYLTQQNKNKTSLKYYNG